MSACTAVPVMPGRVPSIPLMQAQPCVPKRDGQVKPGHDDGEAKPTHKKARRLGGPFVLHQQRAKRLRRYAAACWFTERSAILVSKPSAFFSSSSVSCRSSATCGLPISLAQAHSVP